MRVRSRSFRRGTLRSRRQGGVFGWSKSLQGRNVDTLKRGCILVAEGTFHKKCTFNNKSQWKERSFELYIDDESKQCRILYFTTVFFGRKVLKGTRVLSKMMMLTTTPETTLGPKIAPDEIQFTALIRQSGQSMSKETTEPLTFKFKNDDYIRSNNTNTRFAGTNAVDEFQNIIKHSSQAEPPSLPLHSSRRLRAHIVHHPSHPPHLPNHSRRHRR